MPYMDNGKRVSASNLTAAPTAVASGRRATVASGVLRLVIDKAERALLQFIGKPNTGVVPVKLWLVYRETALSGMDSKNSAFAQGGCMVIPLGTATVTFGAAFGTATDQVTATECPGTVSAFTASTEYTALQTLLGEGQSGDINGLLLLLATLGRAHELWIEPTAFNSGATDFNAIANVAVR